MALKDSGKRRKFDSGAVRDIAGGKGRCDLLPLVTIGEMNEDLILQEIGKYVYDGAKRHIENALRMFIKMRYLTCHDAMLEVSKHYEDGAIKYQPRNWEKGIPHHCYVDSGVRHYFKYMRGDTDEPHDRAFIWNMLGLLWNHDNKPELNDLPFREVAQNESL